MPEAYVPLPDGRSIPVTLKGGGMGGNTIVNVNVVEGQGTKATVNQRQEDDGSMSIDIMVEQFDGMMASRLSRGRSSMGQAMERMYGLNRAAGATR